MKKLLVLMLVLGMASLANATVIDVVLAGAGSLGHAGTSVDPLEIGETIEIKLVLNYNDNPSPPPQDGYLLSSMDLSLDVSGPGTMDAGYWYYGNPIWMHNAGLSPFAVVDPDGATNPPYTEIADGLDKITGVALTPIRGAADLMWDLIITCTGGGYVNVDLSIHGTTQYAPYADITGTQPKPDPPGWVNMVNADLGDLIIHQIPEPATIALLGLGGLCLLRRRR